MADWPAQLAEHNRVVISTTGEDSAGSVLFACGALINNSTWPTANKAFFVPVRIRAPFLAQYMAIYNGSAVSGNFDIGIYDDQGSRLVSSGSTAHSTINVIQTVDITDTLLLPGLHYLALAFDNTTANLRRNAPTNVQEARAAGVVMQTSAFALPSTATFATTVNAYVPLIMVAGRTVI